jgi:hypothetical protein
LQRFAISELGPTGWTTAFNIKLEPRQASLFRHFRAKEALVAEGGVIADPVPLAVVRAPKLPDIPSAVFPLSMQEASEDIPRELPPLSDPHR